MVKAREGWREGGKEGEEGEEGEEGGRGEKEGRNSITSHWVRYAHVFHALYVELHVRCYLLQMSGLSGFVTGWPLPTGAFVKSSNSFSGQQDRRLATFAVSITDPPPTARNPSNWFLRAKEMASSKLGVHVCERACVSVHV